MKRSNRLTATMMGILLFLALAPARAGNLSLQPGSKLWLEGKSTIHEYRSTTTALRVTFEENATQWPADAKGGEAIARYLASHGVTSIETIVPVTELHSGKTGLDKNMYKALLAPKHPEIRFKLSDYSISAGGQPDTMAIEAKGTLSIAGVDREVQLPVTAVRERDQVRLTGHTPLLMTQYGIKPPTMMLGTLRTSDQVVVHFDLLIGRADSTQAGSRRE